MDLRLSGSIAVVTGASKGIGLAVTRTLLQEGASVVAASRGRTSELDALDALDGELLHVAADLMEPGAPGHVITRAVERFGGLDILVNNAGGPPPGTKLPQFGFLDLSDDGWHAMLEFNLLSAVRACRAAIPLLVERGGGSIVNITSGHARQPSAVNVDYGAAKAALANLTKALSEEFGAQGVRVNSVCPGPVAVVDRRGRGGRHHRRADGRRSRDPDHDRGAADDAARHRAPGRGAGDRRRRRAARLAPLGEHDRHAGRRRLGLSESELTGPVLRAAERRCGAAAVAGPPNPPSGLI